MTWWQVVLIIFAFRFGENIMDKLIAPLFVRRLKTARARRMMDRLTKISR